MRIIEGISKIYCKLLVNGQYSYGFTISFENGEFHNHVYHSDLSNDTELLKKLEIEKEKYIKAKGKQ